MFVTYAGIVVFALIALALPAFLLLRSRADRAPVDTEAAPRRRLVVPFGSGDATVEQFLSTVAWIAFATLIVLLYPWGAAYATVTTLTAIELGITLVVVLVTALYGWRRGIWRVRRAAVTPKEPAE